MARLDALEDAIRAALTRMSGRSAAVLATLLYAGGGLVLPLSLGFPVPVLVLANIFATMLAGIVILGWLAGQVDAGKRRHLLEWTTSLRLLNAQEFEWLVGELFRREGWAVVETGKQDRPDGNIDLELSRDGQRMIVQCKRWQSWQVGVNDIRSFAGTLMREGLAGNNGIFVTLSEFTVPARAEAEAIGLNLVDNRGLYSRIENVRRIERCDTCKEPMILDRSPRGWWFRCVKVGCQGKRDLGKDPGAAVDLLTQPPVT